MGEGENKPILKRRAHYTSTHNEYNKRGPTGPTTTNVQVPGPGTSNSLAFFLLRSCSNLKPLGIREIRGSAGIAAFLIKEKRQPKKKDAKRCIQIWMLIFCWQTSPNFFHLQLPRGSSCHDVPNHAEMPKVVREHWHSLQCSTSNLRCQTSQVSGSIGMYHLKNEKT